MDVIEILSDSEVYVSLGDFEGSDDARSIRRLILT